MLSKEAKKLSAVSLILIPSIIYGGITLLKIITGLGFGPESLPQEVNIDLWIAGHAHAGVLILLSLIIQILLDSSNLPKLWNTITRWGMPLSALTISGGFFGISFFDQFQYLLIFGIIILLFSVISTAIGLLRQKKTISNSN
jgi:hypothetical protein